MKKMLLFLLLILNSSYAAENFWPYRPNHLRQGYGYMDLGVGPLPLPLPCIGMGYRQQFDRHGFDASFQIASLVCLKGNLDYLHFFHPSFKAQSYCGFGIGVGHIFIDGISREKNFFSPQLVLGREWKNSNCNRRFAQMRANWPAYSFSKVAKKGLTRPVTPIPLLEFSYGIGF